MSNISRQRNRRTVDRQIPLQSPAPDVESSSADRPSSARAASRPPDGGSDAAPLPLGHSPRRVLVKPSKTQEEAATLAPRGRASRPRETAPIMEEDVQERVRRVDRPTKATTNGSTTTATDSGGGHDPTVAPAGPSRSGAARPERPLQDGVAISGPDSSSWGPVPEDEEAFIRDLTSRRDAARANGAACDIALGLDLNLPGAISIGLIMRLEGQEPLVDIRYLSPVRWVEGKWAGDSEPFYDLRDMLDFLNPDVIHHRETPVWSEPKLWPPRRVFHLPDFASSAELVARLAATLEGWAAGNGVPCRSFSVARLKKRYTGQAGASSAALVMACNHLLQTRLDPEHCRKTHVDQVAIAALGLIDGAWRDFEVAGKPS